MHYPMGENTRTGKQLLGTVRNRSVGARGFTLIEIITVLVIIVIIVAIAAPITIRQIRLYTLDSAVSVISNKVKEARMEAIKRNRTSKVRLDADARNAQIKSMDDSDPPNAINVGYPMLFSEGVDLDPASSVEISFDSFGRLTPATQVTVTMRESSSGKRKNIVVSPAGRVTVGPAY